MQGLNNWKAGSRSWKLPHRSTQPVKTSVSEGCANWRSDAASSMVHIRFFPSLSHGSIHQNLINSVGGRTFCLYLKGKLFQHAPCHWQRDFSFLLRVNLDYQLSSLSRTRCNLFQIRYLQFKETIHRLFARPLTYLMYFSDVSAGRLFVRVISYYHEWIQTNGCI
jgi:hypothetical protein